VKNNLVGVTGSVSERSIDEGGKRSPINWDKYAKIGNVRTKRNWRAHSGTMKGKSTTKVAGDSVTEFQDYEPFENEKECFRNQCYVEKGLRASRGFFKYF